jgi:predicted CXXCH cytochrome family protein
VPCVLGIAALAASQPGARSRADERAFPHEKHARLFPVCEGCHAGVSSGSAEEAYPEPADCASCHDGARAKRVEWRGPTPRASNVRFSHPEHVAKTARAGDRAVCQSCHAAGGEPSRMNVGPPQPALCVGCHAHRADTHLAANAACSQCHAPLTRATALPAARVASFPRPPWHDTSSFVSTHGRIPAGDPRAASCATCHARETCARCHANADRLPPVAALAPDARVAALEAGKKPVYPVPPSHRDAEWRSTHGGGTRRDAASCANCHTRPSCTGCHLDGTGTARSAIASLPDVRPGVAPGVSRDSIAADVHPPDIATRHGTLASTGKLQCAQCHSPQTCSACHAGSDSRAFHAANFVERHATDVFAGSGSCQSCHSTETFCRDCHTRSGIAAQSRMNAAFHTGQPMWVLSHGQAARTGMESCASCHRQSDCVRCHSAVGGWRVNPHGPGFPASRLAARNAASCRWCHSATGGGGD